MKIYVNYKNIKKKVPHKFEIELDLEFDNLRFESSVIL